MIQLRKPSVEGRRLQPAGWRVRAAFSPFATGWGGRWWSLLVCDEGLVAFQWPTRKYLRQMLRIGFIAGVGHAPPQVEGDAWPLSPGSKGQDSPAAELFSRDRLEAIDIKRSRFFWSHVHLREGGRRARVFTVLDPSMVEECAERLTRAFPGLVRRVGWWPAG